MRQLTVPQLALGGIFAKWLPVASDSYEWNQDLQGGKACTTLSCFIWKNFFFIWGTTAKKQGFRSDSSVLELLLSTCIWVPSAQAVEQAIIWINPLAKW